MIRARDQRDGYVIVAVLIVIVVLSLAAYTFTDLMTAEHKAALRVRDNSQARLSAVSGVHFVAAALADQDYLYNQLGGTPTAASVTFREIPEPSTRVAGLVSGEFDIITNVAPDQIDAINNSGSATVEQVNGTRRMQVGFNLGKGVEGLPGAKEIQDPKVRFAMQYAVDVPGICSQLLGTGCTRMTSLVNPPNGNPDLEPIPYDPDMA